MAEQTTAGENYGKCIGCGYLSWRRHNDDGSPHFEVTSERRQSGECPTTGELRGVSNAPYCFRKVLPMIEFDASRQSGLGKSDSFLAVIRSERNCGKFFEYCEGSTPEGHEEMELAKIQAQSAKDAAELAARQANIASITALEQAKDALTKANERHDRIRAEDKSDAERIRIESRNEAERIRIETQEIIAAHNASERKLKIWLGVLPIVVTLISGPTGFFLGQYFDGRANPNQQGNRPAATSPTK